MVKASGVTRDGATLIVIGLTRRNCELLLGGLPITVLSEEVGLPKGLMLCVFAGETEETIMADLQNEGVEADTVEDRRKKRKAD